MKTIAKKQHYGPTIFDAGKFFATPGAIQDIPPAEMADAMYRHLRGDWGNVGIVDWKAHETALEDASRLFSVYRSKAGTKFWIITEADRSVTTLLKSTEY